MSCFNDWIHLESLKESLLSFFFLYSLTKPEGRQSQLQISERRDKNVRNSWQPSFFAAYKFLCFSFFYWPMLVWDGVVTPFCVTGGRRWSFADAFAKLSKQFDKCATQRNDFHLLISVVLVWFIIIFKGHKNNQVFDVAACRVCESQWPSCFWRLVHRKS